MNGCTDRYGTYICPLIMSQVLLQVHGLILKRLLAATNICLNRFLPIMVFPISFLLINELYSPTRKKVTYLTTKTPIHSSLTPAINLNQAAYHKLKDA